MGWTVPDRGEGANDLQSILMQEYLEALVASISGVDCVLSGGAVTPSASLTVAIAKCGVLTNGVLKAVAATTKTVGTADATNPRLDLIVVDSSGAVQVRAGTAAAAPKPPARTANDVLLAVIYVAANDTTIGATEIIDLRAFAKTGPIVIKKVTTQVLFNNTNAIQTYLTVTVPDGLLLSGRQLRVRCGGTMLNNAVTTLTFTLTLAYGGTTMFADASIAVSASQAARHAWDLDFVLTATGDATQVLVGQQLGPEGSPANPAAPTTGTAGNLAISSNRVQSTLRGSASVNSDSANRDLTVQWTMSGANANKETTMDYATVELL